MWYAKKNLNGSWSASAANFQDSFPVVTSKEIVICEILVFDEANQQWVEDSTLEATYNENKAKQDTINLRIRKQQFGAEFMAKVIELNVSKVIAGTLTPSDLAAMDLDSSLQAMERSAWRGNLTTLKSLMQSYVGAYYTPGEITDLVAFIDASGLI